MTREGGPRRIEGVSARSVPIELSTAAPSVMIEADYDHEWHDCQVGAVGGKAGQRLAGCRGHGGE